MMDIKYDFKGSPKRDFTASIFHPETTPMTLTDVNGCSNMLYADGTPNKPSEFDPATWGTCGGSVDLFDPVAVFEAIFHYFLCLLFGMC